MILVVDDEPDMLENVTRILRRSSYACVTARDGPQAMALLAETRPKLILTDLRMPGMDGLALLRAVKRVAPETPVILFTAYASEGAAHEAAHAGATAFLAKPFTATQLLQAVRQTMAGEPPAGAAPRPS